MYEMQDMLENKNVTFALRLKTSQLQRENLQSITYQQVFDTLKNEVWAKGQPHNIHKAVNDIMNLKIQTVVSYLANDAVVKGAHMDLDDLDNLLKGDFYE